MKRAKKTDSSPGSSKSTLQDDEIDEAQIFQGVYAQQYYGVSHALLSSPFGRRIARAAFGPIKPPWHKRSTSIVLKLLKELFDLIDNDGGGGVTAQELHVILEDIDQTVMLDEVEAVLHSMDIDKDGELDFGEFLNALSNSPIYNAWYKRELKKKKRVRVVEYTPRQKIFYSAIADFIMGMSPEEIQRYYERKSRPIGSTLTGYLRSQRLQGLSEWQMVIRQMEARELGKDLLKYSQYPYSQPQPLVVPFHIAPLPPSPWTRPSQQRFNKRAPLDIDKRIYERLLKDKIVEMTKPQKKRKRERPVIEPVGFFPRGGNRKNELMCYLFEKYYLPLPICRYPRERFKVMSTGGCTYDDYPYLPRMLRQIMDEYYDFMKAGLVQYSKKNWRQVASRGFTSDYQKFKMFRMFNKYLPLCKGDAFVTFPFEYPKIDPHFIRPAFGRAAKH